ncbi:uncharacterized protein VP01_4759g2, partial [Puccinia sorghi]
MDALNARLDELMRLPQRHGWPTKPRSRSCLQPQLFDGTRGAAAEAFVSQIGLHAVTYPKQFPTETSKVVFAV